MKPLTLTFAITIAFTTLFAIPLTGCASTGSASSKLRSGDVQLTAEITASKSLTPDFIVKLNPNSHTIFRGSVAPTGSKDPSGSDAYVMTVDQMHWFSNWHDGWTEADITTTGSLLIVKNGTKWDVSVLSKLVPEQTTAAKVRYRDTIKRNDQAISLMNRRIERITATVEWLAKNLPVESFSGSGGIKSFEKENRSPGEGYSWDVMYTKETFPEYMIDIRDTGTLFRDWEESTDLVYFMYLQQTE